MEDDFLGIQTQRDDLQSIENSDSEEEIDEQPEECECTVSVSTSLMETQHEQLIKMALNFLEDEIVREYMKLPEFTGRILINEEIIPDEKKRSMEIPVRYFNLPYAHRFQRTVMCNMGIPSFAHKQVFRKISDAVGPLLLKPGTSSVFASVDIKLVSVYESEYRNKDKLIQRGNPFPLPEPLPRTLLPPATPLPSNLISPARSPLDVLTRLMFLNEVSAGATNSTCAVCMEEFEDGDDVLRLPCCHLYHDKCIGEWFKKSHLCPLCRYQMPPIDSVQN